MSFSKVEEYKIQIKVSDKEYIPYSFISRDFYTNALRLGFIMYRMQEIKGIKFTSNLLRILLNLYNSPKILRNFSVLFSFKDSNIIKPQVENQLLFIEDFFTILSYLISKGLISQSKDTFSSKIFFSITMKFNKIIENVTPSELEPYLLEKLDLINNMLKQWIIDDFIKFIQEEVREIL